jgi:hypothetical protein
MLKKSIFYSLATAGSLLAIGTYDYSDNMPPASTPPGGLSPSEVPMFVSIGFDDNSYSGIPRGGGGDKVGGGVSFVVNDLCNAENPAGNGNSGTYDGEPISVSFFVNSIYGGDQQQAENPLAVKLAWNDAYSAGHEIGNHTHSHGNGAKSSVEGWSLDSWNGEVSLCSEWITKPKPDTTDPSVWWSNNDWKVYGAGVDSLDITGFRNPFLAYSENTFLTIREQGLTYDCSIEEGFQPEADGRNYNWPYTLDNGSPGHNYLKSIGRRSEDIGTHPGVWEMGIRPVILPPDSLCEQYGIESGFRARSHANDTMILVDDGKMTALDYNMWLMAKMSKDEFVATLKYTLDLRLQGNRAPFLLGCHSDEYSTAWVGNNTALANTEQRQAALKEFFQYALSKPEVRIVSYDKILNWIKNPVPLSGKTSLLTLNSGVNGLSSTSKYNYVIYDLRGRKVAAIHNGTPVKISHSLLKKSGVAPGNYILRISNQTEAITRKISFGL